MKILMKNEIPLANSILKMNKAIKKNIDKKKRGKVQEYYLNKKIKK